MTSPYLFVSVFHNPVSRSATYLLSGGVSLFIVNSAAILPDVDAETALLLAVIAGVKFSQKSFSGALDGPRPTLTILLQDAAWAERLNTLKHAPLLGSNKDELGQISELKTKYDLQFFTTVSDVPESCVIHAAMRGWKAGFAR
jgi:hypothetical protein